MTEMKSTARKFRRYPIFFLGSNYIALLVTQIPIFYLANQFHSSILGAYTMATSVIFIPVNLLGNSMGNVFLRRFIDAPQEELKRKTRTMVWILLSLIVIPVFTLIFFAEPIFTFILGDNWLDAAKVVSLLGFLVFHEILFTILHGLIQLRSLEKHYLITESFSLLVNVFYVILSISLEFDFFEVLTGFIVLRLLQRTISLALISRYNGLSIHQTVIGLFIVLSILVIVNGNML